MRHGRHLAAVPALALLLAVATSAGLLAQAAPPNLVINNFGGPACAEIGETIGDQISITMANSGGNLPAAPPSSDCSDETDNTCVWIGFYISTDDTITPEPNGDTLLSGGRENLHSVSGSA